MKNNRKCILKMHLNAFLRAFKKLHFKLNKNSKKIRLKKAYGEMNDIRGIRDVLVDQVSGKVLQLFSYLVSNE